MCYDVSYFTQKKKNYAKRQPDKDMSALETLFDEKGNPIKPIFHVTGFEHPKLPVITNENPDEFNLFEWGLIPFWSKSEQQAQELHNKTLNAKSESMFEKPAFRKAAAERRCIIMVDGFFEHHHQHKQLVPYYISLKDGVPMSLAGIWEEWKNPENLKKTTTVSIVTTAANPLMTQIHNNPKLKEARMPLILPEELESEWLMSITDKVTEEQVKALMKPLDEKAMQAWPVKPIRGKKRQQQTVAITEKYKTTEQLGLF